MDIKEIKNIAKKKGIKILSSMGKKEIIRSIQKAEGNSECFGTGKANICGQIQCSWRMDCSAL